MKRAIHAVLPVLLLLVVGPVTHAGLYEYVAREDGSFTWKVEEKYTQSPDTVWRLRLTSQVWRDTRWEHDMFICEPAEVKYPDTVLLLIAGGSNERKPRLEDAQLGMALARLCGGRCAVLGQVPNQPLLGGRKEDDLIAETFVHYITTGDETWPLLFPMAKSAVRAMDAVQAWAKQEERPAVKQFVVTGASKRGWTTWLTAAVDRRVVAMAPMVIDMLNIDRQIPRQLEAWGKFSEQIEDYTRRGLVQPENQTPQHDRLWNMVDPFTYRRRYTMPKLAILGTNDRYWTLNALEVYWNDLEAPKNIVYVPNAGHNLQPNRDYALHGIAALFRSAASGRKLPEVTWKHTHENALRLTVQTASPVKSATLWVARSATRDFREAKWEASAMRQDGSAYVGQAPKPGDGHAAWYGDLEFDLDGLSYHLATQMAEWPEPVVAPTAK